MLAILPQLMIMTVLVLLATIHVDRPLHRVAAQSANEVCYNNAASVCVAGHYNPTFRAHADAASPTGCQCTCNPAWSGYDCSKCDMLGSVFDAAAGTCACDSTSYPAAPWQWDSNLLICKRPCDNNLDCSGHAGGWSGWIPIDASCRCPCRNFWYGTEGKMCNSCPVQLNPGQAQDCGQCGEGFVQLETGVPHCNRDCSSIRDCNSRALRVAGMWISNISNCSCECDGYWTQPDCARCPWPYALDNNSECKVCASSRDLPPRCIGRCSKVNCTAPYNVDNVSRDDATGTCTCHCRNEWKGANSTDCSVCPRSTGVEHRDCAKKTKTHELTETDSTSWSASATRTSSVSESLSMSATESLSISPSASLSLSLSATSSLTETSSSSYSDTRTPSQSLSPNQTLSDSASATGTADRTRTYSAPTPIRTLSLTQTHEVTATDSIVVCFKYDCGTGANNTFYSRIERRCVCNCRNRWQNNSDCNTQFCQCGVCTFNINASLDCGFCALGFYNMTPLVPTIRLQEPPLPIYPITTTTTTTTTTTMTSTTITLVPSPVVLPPGRCDCASHVLTELSVPTAIGIPDSITSYVEGVSADVVRYLVSKCFGLTKIYAIPYSAVVDLGTNIITSKFEIIALTSPDMLLESCLLKPSATACLVNALSTVAMIPNVDAPPTKVKRDICIPMSSVLSVTNFTLSPPSSSPPSDGSPASASVPSDCFAVNLEVPFEVPYSPCANATQLSCLNASAFDVLPAAVPSWLWLILLILGASLIVLGVMTYCCCRYYPVFAAYRERKRKQEHEELLLAIEEAELEEKEAGVTLPGDDEISTCSEGDDDEADDENNNKKESTDSDDNDDDDDEATENTKNNQNSKDENDESDENQVMISVPNGGHQEENANDYFDGHNAGVDDFDLSNREYQIKKRNRNKFHKDKNDNFHANDDNDQESEEALLLRDQLGIGRTNNYYPAKKRSTRANNNINSNNNNNNNNNDLDSFANQSKQEVEEDLLYSPQQHENYYDAKKKPRNNKNANNNDQDDDNFANENFQRNATESAAVAPEVDDFSYRRRPARTLFSSSKNSSGRTGRERKPREVTTTTTTTTNTADDNTASQNADNENDETTDEFFLPIATPNRNNNANNKQHRRTLSAQERLNEVEEEADLDARVSRAGSSRSAGRRSPSNNHAAQLGDDDYTPRTASGMRARQLSLSMMDDGGDGDDRNNRNHNSTRRSKRNNNNNSEGSNNRSGRDVWNSLTRVNVDDI